MYPTTRNRNSLGAVQDFLLLNPEWKGVAVNNALGLFAPYLYRPILVPKGWSWLRREWLLQNCTSLPLLTPYKW